MNLDQNYFLEYLELKFLQTTTTKYIRLKIQIVYDIKKNKKLHIFYKSIMKSDITGKCAKIT